MYSIMVMLSSIMAIVKWKEVVIVEFRYRFPCFLWSMYRFLVILSSIMMVLKWQEVVIIDFRYYFWFCFPFECNDNYIRML